MSSRSRWSRRPAPRILFSLTASLALAACGSGSGSGDTTYGIHATVSGLENSNSVVLQVNGDAGITVSQNDVSVILGYLPAGRDYTVTVKTYPTNPTETCAVFNGTGTVGHADVQDVTVTCSTHATTVVQFEPAQDSTNAWIHDPIVVHFSSAVNPNSITTDSLRVSAGGAVLGRSIVAVNGDPNALQVQLDALPQVPADMKITLTGDIADASGNRLLVPNGGLVWTWKYPAWQAPGGAALQNVSATDDAWLPAVAVYGGRDIYVAFPEAMPNSDGSRGTLQTVIVKHWDGTAWERLGDPLNHPTKGGVADQPSIAVDSSGRPVVAFNETTPTQNNALNLYVRRWNPSTATWEPLGASLNTDPNSSANWPELALDSNGNPFVAWWTWVPATTNAPAHNVALLRRWNNGVWEAPITLNRNDTEDADYPVVATDSSGGAYVTFTKTAGGVHQVLMTRITWAESAPTMESFGSLADNYVLGPTTGGRSALAVSQNAGSQNVTVYVTLVHTTGTTAATDVLLCTVKDGSVQAGFTTIGSNLVSQPTQITGSPSMTVDGSGHPVVAWDEWNIARTLGSFTVQTENGATWTPMPGLPMAMDPTNNSHAPQLAFNDGQLVVAWRERTSASGPYNIFLKRYNH